MATDPDALAALARAVATDMGRARNELADVLKDRLAEGIPELDRDPAMLDLLFASIASNLDLFVQAAVAGGPIEAIAAPPAALDYARNLAQHNITPNALLRAYRLGQAGALEWALRHIDELSPDRDLAVAASAGFVTTSFAYVDAISEQLVQAYEAERIRWISHRSAVQAAALVEVLAGTRSDVVAAETALGYRLRQHHLGLILWQSRPADHTLGELERSAGRIGKALGAAGPPLFMAQDEGSGWAWLPLGRAAGVTLDETTIDGLIGDSGSRVALGAVAAGVDGFRRTHQQASAARRVALVARDRAPAVIAWTHPQLRAAAMLARDVPSARQLVRDQLGELVEDNETAAGFRESLLVFLSFGGGYAAMAAAMHIHPNTAKYRIGRAAELRGRPIDEDRLDLELALVACRWLGAAVLADPAGTDLGRR